MYIQFQVGPYIHQVVSARYFKDTFQQYYCPRGYAGYVGYIFFYGAVGHALYLRLPLGHKRDRHFRQAKQLSCQWHILQHYC